ncbi:MAG: GAF domain-containing protein [Bacillota bacterium]
MGNPRRVRGRSAGGSGAGPETPWLARLSFPLVVLLWAVSVVNTYVARVPGFAEAAVWLGRFAGLHLGFFTAGTVLLGIFLATLFSRVPDLSLAGLKVRNPLYLAVSNEERRGFAEERANWEAERKRLAREIEEARKLRQENVALSARVQRLETAATATEVYDFALNLCRHQDSVLERLFVAFHDGNAEFDLVYGQTMGWLAHLAKQLVLKQDRSLNCTIMAYDEARDRCTLVGEVGTKPHQRDRFSPRRGVGVAGRVLLTKQPRVVPDVYQDPDYIRSTDDDPRSLICVPIFSQGKVVGLVNICSRPAGAFTEKDLKTIQFAVDHIALAMGIRRLRDRTRKEAVLRKMLDQFLTPDPEGGEPH